ncbi:hypothetical protein [Galbibacter mesophilus]|uniref:hypothetical protein n=1 Tax=Galbibacter mesophilus TaxID=379069 RepID=UPI00191CAC03|nr:hypothetical protein [Galbibacter mesophilus]MCM5662915.1 hypothetical protein [Galbibacter mesophilus]
MTNSSCNPKEPFIKLDEKGKASILNYNLPQSTCYRASSYLVMDLPMEFFKEEKPQKDNFWDLSEKLSKEKWIEKLKDEMDLAIDTPIFENVSILQKENVREMQIANPLNPNIGAAKAISAYRSESLYSQQQVVEPTIANIPLSNIADKITKGFKPSLKQDLTGKVYLDYKPKPKRANPQITIALRLKMCSYLGDYGAGRTIKTFSLLPGEKTTISIKNWETSTETKKQASNVLDSLSESSANELQTLVESEANHTSQSASSETSSVGGGGGLEAGINLGIIKIGLGGEAKGKKTKSFNSAVSDSVRNLVSSTSTHVSKTNSLRQIEINTETTSTTTDGNQETIVRHLENINKSRVLNFVFRQLLQEFFSITYLDDVSIIYTNGYPDTKRVTSLSGIDDFLEEVIPVDENIGKVKAAILKRLCSIFDYQGTRHEFIECVEEELSCNLKCECLPRMKPEKNCYFRKKSDLKQTYKDITVNGIILDTTHRVVRTSAMVVEALLGQGEALDCHNQKHEEALSLSADLENEKVKHLLEVMKSISDPEDKAKFFKAVYKDCFFEEENEEENSDD